MVSVSLGSVLRMTCVFTVAQLQRRLSSTAELMVDLLSFHLRAELLQEKGKKREK